MKKILDLIFYVLNLPLLPVGHTTVTLAMLLYIIILFTILIAISRSIRHRVIEKVLVKSKLDPSMQSAFSMFLQYSFIGIGGVIILNTAGIEMTALTVVAGALGLGLSLGLQTIAKNVAGGIVILVERPIKLGDRVQIGSTTGDVTRIALRSTTIRNDDHVDVIVPNADFMDQRVSNWTFTTKDVILNIPVVVSSDNDLSQVQELIASAAKAHPKILAEPTPEVLLDSFDGGKFKFIIRVATEDFACASISLKSDLNNAIYRSFRESQVKFDA